jgi:hypothetical protein
LTDVSFTVEEGKTTIVMLQTKHVKNRASQRKIWYQAEENDGTFG